MESASEDCATGLGYGVARNRTPEEIEIDKQERLVAIEHMKAGTRLINAQTSEIEKRIATP